MRTLCYHKIGMAQNQTTGHLKQALNRAIKELEDVGYIKKLPEKKRYIKKASKIWHVVFIKNDGTKELPMEIEAVNPLEQKLEAYGVKKPL